MKISEINVGMEVESEMETRRVKNALDEVSVDRFLVTPALGLALKGSVYHPNLLQMEIDTQTGYGWQDTSVSGPGAAGSAGSQREDSVLQRYEGRLAILQEKPYAAMLFGNKGRNFRDIDFFNRVTVDSQAFGGTTGYRNGPVPFTISAAHQEQVETGFFRNPALAGNPLTSTDNTVALRATNKRRPSGDTTVSYALDQFTRDQFVDSQEGLNHSVSVLDSEILGKNDRLSLNTSGFYNRLNNTDQRSESFSAQEHAVLKHGKNLRSEYHYTFDSRSSGEVDTGGQQGRAVLRHQLYESLTSAVDVDVQSTDSTSPGTSFHSLRPGFGVSESYTKRLGNWGRLNLSHGFRFTKEARENTGQFQQILGEQHTLTDGLITFLGQPLVDRSSIRVTDPTGTLLYQEFLDYLIVEQGALTEIRRASGTTRIPNGGTVAVDYRFAASSSTSFTTTANATQFRLDLFKLVGIYARLNLVDHQGGDPSVLLQDIADKVAGVDVTWRWLHAGAEYQDYDSNLSPYQSLRLFETFTFEPTDRSFLSLDLGQGRQIFPDSGVTQTTYHFIGRFKWRLTDALNYNLEGGMRITKGRGLDQQIGTVRTGLEYAYGKLTANLGYEFLDETFLGETRQKHFMFLRFKRRF